MLMASLSDHLQMYCLNVLKSFPNPGLRTYQYQLETEHSSVLTHFQTRVCCICLQRASDLETKICVQHFSKSVVVLRWDLIASENLTITNCVSDNDDYNSVKPSCAISSRQSRFGHITVNAIVFASELTRQGSPSNPYSIITAKVEIFKTFQAHYLAKIDKVIQSSWYSPTNCHLVPTGPLHLY